MHHRDVIERVIGPIKAKEFALWAFSDEYKDLRRVELWIVWNFRHGEKLKLHANGTVDIDIPKMIEIWEKETKQ